MRALWLLATIFINLTLADFYCPTVGTSAYIFTTITEEVDVNGFIQMLTFYSQLMPRDDKIDYHFYFGNKETDTVTTANIAEEVGTWLDDEPYLEKIYNASLVYSDAIFQYDDPTKPLTDVTKSIFTLIYQQNQQPLTCVLKKQVVLLTNYVPMNVTLSINNDPNVNVQRFGLFHGLPSSEENLQNQADFPVYSTDDDRLIPELNIKFQAALPFQFPPVHETKPLADNFIFMTSPDDVVLSQLFNRTINGGMCQLQQTRMYSQFISLKVASNNTLTEVYFPWLGTETQKFVNKCIKSLPKLPDSGCDQAVEDVVNSFTETVNRKSNNMTFITFVSHDDDCIKPLLDKSGILLANTTSIRFVSSSSLTSTYNILGKPLISSGFLSSDRDHQLINNSVFYISNYSTLCVSEMVWVPLSSAYPYHRPKHLYIALDDILWISLLASVVCISMGCILYAYVKKSQKKQQALLNEIIMQERPVVVENVETPSLPWEIKPEKVQIDRDILLGEGTVSNVYLGKLKGKSPIMQWFDKIEMKQYQDCAVAVRVPKYFDEPEVDQLSREIASMRRLRHHEHVALLLGWTKKDNQICSLLELTHINLVRYLSQIKETVNSSAEGPTSCKYIPYQLLYKIIWEICDGMAYIHHRNLVHRDLTARNVLLTTGLRVKISGFGFCSEAEDHKFGINSVAMRFLPVRWMAPECFQGKFSTSTDIWSFSITLYEIFTLGDIPYEDLRKPEDIIEAVRKGRIPTMPYYATKETYNTMKSCLQQFPERRPHFGQLMEVFKQHFDNFYSNSAFEED